jgi:hypothetical protein
MLLLGSGRQRGDDQLRSLGPHQVMQLHARFLMTGRIPVGDGVTGQLRLVGMGDLFGVGYFSDQLKINDPAAGTNQIDDPNQGGQAMPGQIGFNRYLDSFGLFVRLDWRRSEVMLQGEPA